MLAAAMTTERRKKGDANTPSPTRLAKERTRINPLLHEHVARLAREGA